MEACQIQKKDYFKKQVYTYGRGLKQPEAKSKKTTGGKDKKNTFDLSPTYRTHGQEYNKGEHMQRSDHLTLAKGGF